MLGSADWMASSANKVEFVVNTAMIKDRDKRDVEQGLEKGN